MCDFGNLFILFLLATRVSLNLQRSTVCNSARFALIPLLFRDELEIEVANYAFREIVEFIPSESLCL